MNLHLKKIEIQGFKSFADKIEIEFKEGITSIVGPNGSGKSNISDAIRWVLGEQSVKALRGSRMEDVIFSGTSKRRALGFAEVTITFDNKDGGIPIDYKEVAITRRMFRSGESEYYLNKNSCRLKDIRELLMDTGIGIDGYSIIGQGKVDEILSTRPEDRRGIFEEAAGIVKYKSKKEAAEKKLEKTNENLVRIKDILNELEKQSRNLRVQSEKANVFIELSERLKKLEVNLFIRKIDMVEKKIAISKEEKTKLQVRIDDILSEKCKIEEDLNLINLKVKDNDISLDRIQQEKTELSNLLNKKKNNLKILEEKERFYSKDIGRLKVDIENLERELKDLESKNVSSLEEKKSIDEQFNLLKKKLEKNKAELKEIDDKIGQKEKIIEKKKDEVVSLYNEITDKKGQINSMENFQKNIDKRIVQIEKEICSLMDRKKMSNTLLKEIETLELENKDEIVKYNRLVANLKLNEKEDKHWLDVLYGKINQNKADLQGKISSFNLLKNMEEDYEGYYRSVKNLMLACKKEKELKDRLIGIVAELLKVDEKYEKAIDIALGGSLQNVVTQDEEDAKFIIDYLRKKGLGRVTFLPLSTIKDRSIYISSKDREKYSILGLGSELVNYNEKYRDIIGYLLGRTIIVESLDHATLAAKRFNYSFRIVTLEGDIINPGGSMTGGSLPKVSGNLLNRKHRISSLKKEINHLSKVQRDLEEEKTALKLRVENNLNKLKSYEEKLQSANIETIKLENEKEKHRGELKRCWESIEKYKDEIKELSLELDEIKDTKATLNKDIDTLKLNNNSIKKSIEGFMVEFEKEKAIKEEMEERVTNSQIQVSLLENKLMNKKDRIEEIEKELEEKAGLKKAKEIECLNMEVAIENIRNEMISTREDIEKTSELLMRAEKDFNLLRNKKENLMKKLYQQQSQLKEVNEIFNRLEKEKNNWNIKDAKYDVQLDNLMENLLESYGLGYTEALELLIEINSLEDVSSEVKKLKEKIKNLGSVNLNSIEEYRNTMDRLEFMNKQCEDLISAKENLQEVILDMEMKMKKQFLYNFNKIDESFSQVFALLFDGGKANLVLEDKENILTCGIEIQAQPPGKKLQNLSLLSGGEKSLTAVALLFAIFQIKPAPFCILDEIDAALDEANISRYTNYLKSLSGKTQFIMITHRKGTMEIADILYGVTMEEEGVSKIVSVKLTSDLDEIAS